MKRFYFAILLLSLCVFNANAAQPDMYDCEANVTVKPSQEDCPTTESTQPNSAISKIIQDSKLEVVDYKYVRSKLGTGIRGGSLAVLIDARPTKRYNAGTIPSAIQIQDTEFDSQISRIADTPKDKEIIVFCQGYDCTKSLNVSLRLKAAGYTNVKLYQPGFPDWQKHDYIEIGTDFVSLAFDKNSALLIDARPKRKFLAETIPGAMSLPDTDFDKLKGFLPGDKTMQIITFCNGYDCKKSHFLAQKLIELGYKNVANYSAGLPGWKAASLPTTKDNSAAAKKQLITELKVPYFGPIKKGLDKGSVDSKWFVQNYQKLPKDVTLIDIRTADERALGYIEGSKHISIDDTKDIKKFIAQLPKGYVIFYCSTGTRSLEAYEKVIAAGYDKGLFLDAPVKCKGKKCNFTINEPLMPTEW
ncbi:MAG: rhodanese-like domain-containing protein [Campylobacter sp.]|nr:rhodanese-like domain-containing protein [Campylobacter sp.]